MDLAGDLQDPFIGDAAGRQGFQPDQRRRIENLGLIQIPTKSHLGVDFINVLAARSTAPREHCLQFRRWDRQIRLDG